LNRFLTLVLVSVFALTAASSLASALSWCEGADQIDVANAAVTRSTNVFKTYAECDHDAASGVYSCEDYCLNERALAKFHCSLQQPGALRLARRDDVDCASRGYAGCENGACVARMTAAAVPSTAAASPSPAPLPRAWCKPAQSLSAAAPQGIAGASVEGSAYAFTDYCADPLTLAHYYCVGDYYDVGFSRCAGGCAAGACVPQSAVKLPGGGEGAGVWLAYGIVGVLIVAAGVAFWLYSTAPKKEKKAGQGKKKIY